MRRNIFCFIVIFTFICLLSSYSSAQIEGLVIDRTKTKIGRDFYEFLYISLETKLETDGRVNITVDEFVDPQFGSRISVSINDNTVYQNFISSRIDDIEEKVMEATETIRYFLNNWKEYEKYLEEEGKIR
ncbi:MULTISPECIES: CsgE family curli-type amyloid fiber assembly protein [Thermodesulfovibrio]|jgi:curli production assembly/transport component CsgE|uniref:CsgE family curli-type amyloid fiber assembly protein n=1 Tax=Thermodesulfovibrio TaxID=28261 RepID=UPI002606703F|nr:CsgE family curli-type amyloid fiber assembly protein [Thermodesulfovibrio sp.]